MKAESECIFLFFFSFTLNINYTKTINSLNSDEKWDNYILYNVFSFLLIVIIIS